MALWTVAAVSLAILGCEAELVLAPPEECQVTSSRPEAYGAYKAMADKAKGDAESAQDVHDHAERQLAELQARQPPLRDLRAEAASRLLEASESAASDDRSFAESALEKAQGLYKRAEAKTSQAEDDISRVVSTVRELLVQAKRSQTTAAGTIALAEDLKKHVDTQEGRLQDCVAASWASLQHSSSRLKSSHAEQLAALERQRHDAEKRAAHIDARAAKLQGEENELKAKQAKLMQNTSHAMAAAEANLQEAQRAQRRAADLMTSAKAKEDQAQHLAKRAEADEEALRQRQKDLDERTAKAARATSRAEAAEAEASKHMAQAKDYEATLQKRENKVDKREAELQDKVAKVRAEMDSAQALKRLADNKTHRAKDLQREADDAYERAMSLLRDANRTRLEMAKKVSMEQIAVNRTKAAEAEARRHMDQARDFEAKLEDQRAALHKEEATLEEKMQSVKAEMDRSRDLKKQAALKVAKAKDLQDQADASFDRAVAAMHHANETQRQGNRLLGDARARFHNASAMEELADQEMSDAMNVLKGLDPVGQHALHKAFAQLAAASLKMHEAKVELHRAQHLRGSGEAPPPATQMAVRPPGEAEMRTFNPWPWLAVTGLLIVAALLAFVFFSSEDASVSLTSTMGGELGNEPMIALKAGPLACFCLRHRLARAGGYGLVASDDPRQAPAMRGADSPPSLFVEDAVAAAGAERSAVAAPSGPSASGADAPSAMPLSGGRCRDRSPPPFQRAGSS
mmetsp:Transcript_52515/g.115099  ORF Transcript_52515/g.115099 Transcript_52515/m.115099 type:complete len:745 (+) Transcript_52515:109-2343(+)